MLSASPRLLATRYLPSSLKQVLRKVRQQVRQFQARHNPPRNLFVFGGRSQYYPGIGRELYAREPAFRATVQECERVLLELGGKSLLANFEEAVDPLFLADEARMLQIITVIQLASVELWRAYGVQPDAVMGISSGEAAALYAAGGFSLRDALRISLSPALVDGLEPAVYGMLVVMTTFARATELAVDCPVELHIISVTEANRCTFFCTLPAMTAAKAYLTQQGVTHLQLKIQPGLPYHASRLAWHTSQLQVPLRHICPKPLARPCYLFALGRMVTPGTVLGVEYLLQVLQYPAQKYATMQAVMADGYRVFTPIGPNPFPFTHPPKEVHLLRFLTAETSEYDTFAANLQELAGLGLARSQPLPQPALSVTDFKAQFKLQTPEFYDNPHPSLAFLREHGNLHFLPLEGSWLLLDAPTINAVLREPLVYSSSPLAGFENLLVGADPPIHTAGRALFQSFFAPKNQGALDAFSAATIADLAAGLAQEGSFDFVTAFALPLTQAVSARVLGLTPAESQQLLSRLPGHTYTFGYYGELMQYFEEYFRQPRPSAELPTILGLLQDHIYAGTLTLAAAVDLAKVLWLAGVATTSMLISSAVYYLLTHPAVAEQLRAEPELLDNYIEEILRIEPPLSSFLRQTTQPVVLAGQTLPADTIVICSITAANRDPARYSNPDELDLNRPPTRHLAFGGGIHACLGASLARRETQLVLQWVLSQEPALRLAQPFSLPQYFHTPNLRGLATLPVTLQPRAQA